MYVLVLRIVCFIDVSYILTVKCYFLPVHYRNRDPTQGSSNTTQPWSSYTVYIYPPQPSSFKPLPTGRTIKPLHGFFRSITGKITGIYSMTGDLAMLFKTDNPSPLSPAMPAAYWLREPVPRPPLVKFAATTIFTTC